jgi:acylphosphatase
MSGPAPPTGNTRPPDRTGEADASSIRVHIFVEGRVQGVWFRDSTWQQATRLGVSGWARNLPDGRVEAVYEGPRDAVEALLVWTRLGPERALVTAVAVRDETPKGERGFSVHCRRSPASLSRARGGAARATATTGPRAARPA